MRRRAVDGVVATVLAVLCGAVVVAYLRPLLDPAEAWTGALGAVVACAAVAWLVRLLPAGLPRSAGAALAGLAAVLAAGGLRTGRWPVQEDVAGPDGYLGASGYLRATGRALGEMARAWVQVLYPADAAAEPDAVAVVRLVGLVLVLAAAVALMACRAPLPAILAVAAAAAVGSLFIGVEPVWAHALGLAALGVASLGLVGRAADGRRLRAVLGSGALLAFAGLLALAGPLAVGGPAWGWQEWTVEEPEPVGVGFVWEQTLQSLDFRGEEVVVLEVAGRDIGYLRVGVLEGFDAVRWRDAGVGAASSSTGAFALPASGVAPVARIGERPIRAVEVRNVALDTLALPLPGGTVAVEGLPDSALPVDLFPTGSVALAQRLPVGTVFTARVVRVPTTPELLDADLLGAPTDPATALVEGVGDDPVVGRYADRDAVAPWSAGADQRQAAAADGALSQPGPFGQDRLDESRPPRVGDPDSVPAPPAALVSVGGLALPAFGVPGREREVMRMLDARIAEGGARAGALAGWRSAYRVAREQTRAAKTPYQAAVLLEDWFQREFRYDESASYATGAPIGPLPQFVLSSARSGHCQYFAGAMAALLRLHGIPARVAVGFTQGEADGDRRVITNRDAHAWVEVSFPYAGWVAFEPTPTRSLPLSTSSTSPSFAQSAAGVGGDALSGLIGPPGDRGAEGPNRGAADAGAGATGGAATDLDGGAGLGGMAAVAGLLVLAAFTVGLAIWLRKLRRHARAFAVEEPGPGAVALRDVLACWLADQGASTRDADAAAVARALRRLHGIDAVAWSIALEQARYAPPEDARGALRVARRETRELVRTVRGRIDRRARLRGAVRPSRRPRRDAG
ncbi:MAG: transglutaminase-like domain-containing protein [Gaiellales bacterium]